MSESMRSESDGAAFDFEGLFESEATDFGFGIAQYVAADSWTVREHLFALGAIIYECYDTGRTRLINKNKNISSEVQLRDQIR